VPVGTGLDRAGVPCSPLGLVVPEADAGRNQAVAACRMGARPVGMVGVAVVAAVAGIAVAAGRTVAWAVGRPAVPGIGQALGVGRVDGGGACRGLRDPRVGAGAGVGSSPGT
jgi:hypothetical protein